MTSQQHADILLSEHQAARRERRLADYYAAERNAGASPLLACERMHFFAKHHDCLASHSRLYGENMNGVAKISDHVPQSMPIPQATSSNQLLAVLSRMMADPSVDIERIERGAALYERALARDAEAAFNDAMSAVQLELTPIARDTNNPQTHSKYASYFAVDKVIRPIYGKHGFRLSFDTANDGPENHIRVVAILSKGGHSERYHYDSPIVTTGIQGKAMMTLTHAGAAAVTYAKRYLAGMIFNLSTGEDADGNPIMPGGPISLEQVEELVALCDEVSADKEAFCRYFKVGGIAEISTKDFPRAVAALNKKRAAK